MSTTFRKITQQEWLNILGRYGIDPVKYQGDNNRYSAYFEKYYPKTACSALITYNSEYNDEYYTHKPAYVAVYDKDGNELLPLAKTAKEARGKWGEIFGDDSESNYPKDDKVIVWSVDTPELYIKE